jgi:hypothetical protein
MQILRDFTQNQLQIWYKRFDLNNKALAIMTLILQDIVIYFVYLHVIGQL